MTTPKLTRRERKLLGRARVLKSEIVQRGTRDDRAAARLVDAGLARWRPDPELDSAYRRIVPADRDI